MAWVYLFAAGAFEIVWAVCLKYAGGFARPLPLALAVGAMAVSVAFMALALRAIPVGTAYAVWMGIDMVGTAVFGLILFAEPATALRLGCIGLIAAGILGLTLAG